MIAQGDRADSVAPWLLRWAEVSAVFALATLGLVGVGDWSPSVLPFDVVCALGLPAWAWLALRRRRGLLSHPVMQAWLAVAGAWCLAALISLPPGRTQGLGLVKGVQMALVPLGLAAVVRAVGMDGLVRGWLWGAAACLVVGFAGYVSALLGLGGLHHTGPHPLFGAVPRMVGTFGHSPQHFGEFVLLALGLAHATLPSVPPGLARTVRWLGWPALAVTFSSAWLGAVPLCLGLGPVIRRVPWRAVRVAMSLLAAFAVTWMMTFGWPAPEPQRGSLAELDPSHHVLRCDADQYCEQVMRDEPYRAPLTLYRLAKEQAWEAALEAFPWGLGPGGFESYAGAHLPAAPGRRVVAHYITPHSTYLGTVAELGLPGLAALLFFCVALGTSRQLSTLSPLWLAMIGLLLVALNIDVLRQRHLWCALALWVSGGRAGSGADG